MSSSNHADAKKHIPTQTLPGQSNLADTTILFVEIKIALPYCHLCHLPLGSQIWVEGLQSKTAHEDCSTTASLIHGTTNESADRFQGSAHLWDGIEQRSTPW
ncbi:hypothetical protein PIIN_09193 [Serendipita indica DSM 11827]|uniref:Uncharacterized protein n=1 Tax=Serendipita indica (strain DSM 11827) TaxID=1109443 RepID=G4TV66_SERID|nr:hypothetical protein PIIN_09193 [Serendipita indica DSM 11827]